MIDYNKKIDQEFNDRINKTTDEEVINLSNQEIKNILWNQKCRIFFFRKNRSLSSFKR